jgi:hypothetical protein
MNITSFTNKIASPHGLPYSEGGKHFIDGHPKISGFFS